MFTFCSNIIIIELIHLINIIQTSFQILNIKTEAHGGGNLDKLFDVNKPILVLVEYVERISETESEVSTYSWWSPDVLLYVHAAIFLFHQLQELWELNRAATIQVSLQHQVENIIFSRILSHRSHHVKQLRGADTAAAILCKNLYKQFLTGKSRANDG